MSFDLCIIGSGSGNTIIDERFAGWRTALVDSGIFGGTCLNAGCIPTKMYVVPADLALTPRRSARLGVRLGEPRVDWPAIRDRVFGRVDAISREGEKGRRDDPSITVFDQEAHFVGPRRLQIGVDIIEAERIVIAAGSRPVLPEVPGLDRVRVHTSDTVMRLDGLPATMLVLGGGYVAAEFAHIFSAFGTRVTVVNRSGRMLGHADTEVADLFTAELGRRVDVRLRTTVASVESRSGGGVRAVLAGDGAGVLEADVLLVATGRRPNGDRLGLGAGGVDTDEDGFVRVDDFQRTSAAGVFALGDVSSHRMLKHVANAEARVVQHNLLNPGAMTRSDHRAVPQAVFSDPQVASVGLTENAAREQGVRYVVGRAAYGDTAYGWALEDDRHFAKVLADPVTGRLLGAHVLGPQATILIQPVVQAMAHGTGARALARGTYWPHPALTEVIENALLELPLD
ncbi:MAG TPA: mycothione reductase [Microlunatus sp.]|nr:mycothione reductase [Microlunatus sp.]